jgi:uncharacterized cupredoxin-like copper-binding protein
MRTIRHTLALATSAALLATGLAACSDAAADEAAPTTTTTAPTTTTTTTAAPSPEPVTITAIDYGYLDMPSEVPAGTTLVLENSSETELHELVAIRLPDDETRPVADLVQLPPEQLAALFPLVKAVLIAPPGEGGFPVEGTGTLTEPGRYAIICAIPTGADPDEYMAAAAQSEGGPPEVAGGPPHFVQGMFAELTVTG